MKRVSLFFKRCQNCLEARKNRCEIAGLVTTYLKLTRDARKIEYRGPVEVFEAATKGLGLILRSYDEPSEAMLYSIEGNCNNNLQKIRCQSAIVNIDNQIYLNLSNSATCCRRRRILRLIYNVQFLSLIATLSIYSTPVS